VENTRHVRNWHQTFSANEEKMALLIKVYNCIQDSSKLNADLLKRITSALELKDKLTEMNENPFLEQAIGKELCSVLDDIAATYHETLNNIIMFDFVWCPTNNTMTPTKVKIVLKERKQLKRGLDAIGETVANRVHKRSRESNKFSNK
jgi:hypothetical protein